MTTSTEIYEPSYQSSIGRHCELESVFDSIEGIRILLKTPNDVYSLSGEIVYYSVSREPPFGDRPEPIAWAKCSSAAAINEVINSELLARIYGKPVPIFDGERLRHFVCFCHGEEKLDIVVRGELRFRHLSYIGCSG